MRINKKTGCVWAAGVAAALGLCLWARGGKAEAEALRPVRSTVVSAGYKMPDLVFAGIVQASTSRTLVFKQAGRIQRIAVAKGQDVKKGEKLAWLDPVDFVDALSKAEAAATRDRLSYARKSDALKKKAISQEDVSQAEAQLKQSEAAFELAKRALEETVLYAPFDGTIAEVPATELDMVGAANPVVKIQDTSSVNIDVGVAEKYILRRSQFVDIETDEGRTVSFDALPGQSFRCVFKEFQASADRNNQTFVATYTMKAPKGLLLLPGMSATITISGRTYAQKQPDAAEAARMAVVPEGALGVAADGSFFVWRLEPTAEKDVCTVRRNAVTVVRRTDEGVVVTGLAPGVRMATAGVAVLSEGARVRLMD